MGQWQISRSNLKLKLKIASGLTFFLITDEELSEFYEVKYVNSQVEGGRKDTAVLFVEHNVDFFCCIILLGQYFHRCMYVCDGKDTFHFQQYIRFCHLEVQAGSLSSIQHAVTSSCQNKMFDWSKNSGFPSQLIRSLLLPKSNGEMIECYNGFWVESIFCQALLKSRSQFEEKYTCSYGPGLKLILYLVILKEGCICISDFFLSGFLQFSFRKFNNAF